MLVIKLMSGENLEDRSPVKEFTLVTVPEKSKIFFDQFGDNEPSRVVIIYPDGETQEIMAPGNVYVMEKGVTIATFHPA